MTEYPRQATIHGLFAEQAARAPDAVALTLAGERISYADLDARAGRLAARLRRSGAGLEARIGLCVERSPALIAGMLGILKAGGVYVPLDPAYPAERLAWMVEDAGLGLLVVESWLAGSLSLPYGILESWWAPTASWWTGARRTTSLCRRSRSVPKTWPT